MFKHRKINIETDRNILLEYHCQINYECDSKWAQVPGYESYRKKWMSLDSQINEFMNALEKSMGDEKTIAEIIENEDGQTVGYLWVTFFDFKAYELRIGEINEIYVVPEFRGQGLGLYMLKYSEERAIELGANLLRSGTGFENKASMGLHEKYGFNPYRVEYEKVLKK